MKNIPSKISQFLEKHQERWYFMPAFGLLFLTISASSIFAYTKISSQRSTTNDQQSVSPTPTPQGETLGFSDIIEDTRPIPTPTSKPDPTPTPEPSLKPSPSPTPKPIDHEDVRVHEPKHQTNYDEPDLKVHAQALTNKKVVRLEVIVNGDVRDYVTSDTYDKTISLDPGKYTIRLKAHLDDGGTIESGFIDVGLGGIDWNAPDPTPSPTSTESGALIHNSHTS